MVSVYLSRFDEEFDRIEALMRRRYYHCWESSLCL